MAKRMTKTDRIELVETHNLVLALNRLSSAKTDLRSWRRALYHALEMAGVCGADTARRIREAMELP